MTVALILCQTNYIKGADLNRKDQVNHEIVQSNNYLNDKINKIGDFFMKPMNIEKEEK